MVNLSDARVGGAGVGSGNQLRSNGHTGVGLFLADNTRAVLSKTLVISNTFQTAGFTYGGGAYVTGGSVLTLTNSRIEDHKAPSASNGRGAGIYVDGSTVTLDNSQIISGQNRK